MTAEAMVTGRMTRQKKEAGNRVLAELGVTPSAAINGLYDYLIREEKLPYQAEGEFGWQKYTAEQIEEARAYVQSLAIDVDEKHRNMSLEDARKERMVRKLGTIEEALA